MEARPRPASVAPATEARAPSLNGGFVDLEGEAYYRISAFHRLAPFLMSLPSDTDLWMFVASGGGLTAGRVDADGSLFPYRTVDQLHDAHHHTGPLTRIQVDRNMGKPIRWDPFDEAHAESPGVERNLYKNTIGNRVVFEEIYHELGLAFRYRWAGCDEFGWVRSATLENRSASRVRVDLLDGLRNVLPYGAPLSLYQQASNLVDAYKRTEVDRKTNLGIFSLTAAITDRAEALEVLKANTVWCCGLERFRVHLSLTAATASLSGQVAPDDTVRRGGRGNYLVRASLVLEAGESARWHIVGDTGQDHVQVSSLRRRLLEDEDLERQIEESLEQAGENLRRNVASADGLQLAGPTESWVHHFANVLFNNMRGGVFLHNHQVPVPDFEAFLRTRNGAVADRQRAHLAGLPAESSVQDLRDAARATGDADFERLSYEYLPLFFGRRHGDPSRPWNRFAIRVRNQAGERELNYEGNWRDIFQNWEALSTAFPGFLPSMVAKFVNASTVDGFNPYRITREGVDWEIADPDDPWSNIGYWGDHQIIYLLKLLEAMDGYDPAALGDTLGREIFSYADVPYRIKPYEDLLRDSSSTIVFDTARAARIDERIGARGTDGKLLVDAEGSVLHANLLEKLLVPALSKLSNLVPDAGIWMNTQRPEWNDANNALAGGGVSVVTLGYLRRYLSFLAERLTPLADAELPISTEVATWFDRIGSALEDEQGNLTGKSLDARSRKRVMDILGGAFSTYRETVYARGFSGKTAVAVSRVVDLCRTALKWVDWGLAANRRADGLFHTYNVLAIAEDGAGAEVVPLQEMLEGQVSVLSSGFLGAQEALDLLERLFASALYREDQRSFMLYPERDLPDFLDKNVVPDAGVAAIPLLTDLLASGNSSVLTRDADGVFRFDGDFGNAEDLASALDDLGRQEEWSDAVEMDRAAILELFEEVFQHRSYTGRSAVMYGYEGLGCIYWHMVAKLLLAAQENALRAARDGSPAPVRDGLAQMYFRIRSGLGYEKSVAEFGAFPLDPYSHTPAEGGAKQPGMTGQVKEEILTRMGELGIHVENGAVRFRSDLLRPAEFLGRSEAFRYFDVGGQARSIVLSPGSLAFTFCQVPVIYERVTEEPRIRITFTDGSSTDHPGSGLGVPLSTELFSRSGRIETIWVEVSDPELCLL